MAKRFCAVVLAGITLLVASAFAQTEQSATRRLFDDANGERKEVGLPPLAWNDQLAEAARAHAEQMAWHKQLSHRFEGEPALTERVAATKLHFGALAENVAFATYAEDIHSGLMRSLEHRANILSKQTNSLGVAVIRVSDGYYAVEDFAFSSSPADSGVAEQRLITVFQRARKETNKAPGQFTSDSQLRAYACSMANNDDVNVKGIPIPKGFQHMLGYTASEPGESNDALEKVVAEPSYATLAVGACYKATPKYPGGVYWFIIVY